MTTQKIYSETIAEMENQNNVIPELTDEKAKIIKKLYKNLNKIEEYVDLANIKLQKKLNIQDLIIQSFDEYLAVLKVRRNEVCEKIQLSKKRDEKLKKHTNSLFSKLL